jgi:hypothetical protein
MAGDVRRAGGQWHAADGATDGTHGCSPMLRTDRRSHRRLGVRAQSGYGAYGGGRRGRARRRALDAFWRSGCKYIS